jgi:hypothetical protein
MLKTKNFGLDLFDQKSKIMRKSFLLILSFSFFVIACNGGEGEAAKTETESSANQVEALTKEVMDVHDKVMPKLGTLRGMMGKISKLEAGSPEDSASYVDAVNHLKKADDGMMNWMHEFDGENLRGTTWTEEQKVQYLNGELVTINQVEKDTEESLAKAQAILEGLEESPEAGE